MTKILVVDDYEVDRRLVSGILSQNESYTLQFANSGEEAVSSLQRSVPDIVLTDLFMPGIDGMELVQIIRREYPLVPVILMTSRGNEDIAVQALQNGASSYVPKHLLGRYLVETVHSLVQQSRERRSRAKLLGSMRSNQCEFSLENDSELIPFVVGYFQESMSHMGLCDEAERLRASVALEEALTNAVHHGNLEVSSELRQGDDSRYYRLIARRRKQEPYCQRQVHIYVNMSSDEARFKIRDEGPGFDVDQLPDPTDPENLERAGGRGIMLMRTFMDEVTFNEIGNEVTLIKRCPLEQRQGHSSRVIDINRQGDVVVVTLLREVTALTDDHLLAELGEVLDELKEGEATHAVIDLQQVSKFGSSFLEALRRVWNAAREQGGRVAICNITELGRDIIRIAKFDSVWQLCETRQEAIESVRGMP